MSRTRPSVAVIDIGSNSARMIVFERTPSGHLAILRDARAQLKLVRRLASDGGIAGSVEATVEVVQSFLALAEGADSTVAVATAAVREAHDGELLVTALRERCHLALTVLDGADEADLACSGAIHGLPVTSGLMFDIGGGSLEVARYFERRRTASWTLPLGALRVSDTHLRSDPPSGAEMRQLAEAVRQALDEAHIPMLGEGESLVGTGGTVRAVAKIHRAHRTHTLERIHGYRMSQEDVESVCRLVRIPQERRSRIAGVGNRSDSIVGGSQVILTLMDWVGAGACTAAGSGLREGLALRRLRTGGTAPTEVQAASLQALSDRFSGADRELAARRIPVANALAHALIPDASEEVHRALEQAAMVCDVGRAIDYYNRFREAAHCVLVADLAGFGHAELARVVAILEKAGEPRTTLQHYRGLFEAQEIDLLDDAAAILQAADEISQWIDPAEPLTLAVSAARHRVTVRCPLRVPIAVEVGGRVFERRFQRPLIVSRGGGASAEVPIEVR